MLNLDIGCTFIMHTTLVLSIRAGSLITLLLQRRAERLVHDAVKRLLRLPSEYNWTLLA